MVEIRWYGGGTSDEQIKELVDLKFRGILDESCPEPAFHRYWAKSLNAIPDWMRNHPSFTILKE